MKSCIFPICLLFNHHSAAAEKAAFNLTIYLKVKTLLKKFHVLDILIFGCKPKKTVVCFVFGYVRTADKRWLCNSLRKSFSLIGSDFSQEIQI